MSSDARALFVLPSFNRSGAVDFIVDLADSLSANHFSTAIKVLDGKTPPARKPGSGVQLSFGINPPGQHARPNKRPRILDSLAMLRNLLPAVRRSEIVFITWEHGRALTLPAIAAFLTGKPMVAIVQNNIEFSLAKARGRWRRQLLKFIYRRSAAVVCVSYDLVPILEAFGVNRRILSGIPNAIDVDRIVSLADVPLPDELDRDGKQFVLGVGRLDRQKGFDHLICAHKLVLDRGVDHRLVLIGAGPDKRALQDLALLLGVGGSVRFLGYQPNPYPAMRQAAVFCLSSRYEGRALTLAEAAAIGVPIIATDCPTGPREVLADGRFGALVDTENPGALAAAIERHLLNPQKLRRKALNASAQARRYSIHRCAERYARLVHKLLGEPLPTDQPIDDAAFRQFEVAPEMGEANTTRQKRHG